MKECTKCHRVKSFSEFDVQGRRLRSHCKKCVSKYTREHYQRNKEYYIRKAKKNRINSQRKLRIFLRKYKQEHGCVDCGESDPIVLEFDHLKNKSDGLARMVTRVIALDKIMLEIAKCEVVCANCHRRRTAHRRKWYNYPL